MQNPIQIPLNLPDVAVIEVETIEPRGWLIRVESTQRGTHCRQCGQMIEDFHGYDSLVRLQHLPLFEVPVWIELRPKRYRCRNCAGGPTTTQQLSWYQARSAYTTAYEQWLLKLLINSTIGDVSRKLSVSEACVTGVLERWIEGEVNWDAIDAIGVMGIDEISLKRGHRDFVAIVTRRTEQGVDILGVLSDRKQATVETFLHRIPSRLQATVQTVCTDMHEGYVNAVQTELPQAQIVIDRFHVARAYRDCADKVRRQALKRLQQDLPKADYAALKGVMWAFRKRPHDLNHEEKTVLNRFFVYAPEAEQAHTLREQLTDIFAQPQTKVEAEQAIQAWCQRVRKRAISAFDSFLTTLANWCDEITNYFLERHNSGFVEGFNNRIKVLKRRCYGIFDVKRIFQRLTLDLHGYERFAST